jgi:hypothetical protein
VENECNKAPAMLSTKKESPGARWYPRVYLVLSRRAEGGCTTRNRSGEIAFERDTRPGNKKDRSSNRLLYFKVFSFSKGSRMPAPERARHKTMM